MIRRFLMSCGVNLEHATHGCAIPTKDAASPWWLDLTTVGQMASPQPEGDLRDHTHVIHLTLFTPVAPKTGAAPPTFRLGPTLLPLTWASLSSPSSAVPPPPPPPPRKSAHFDTAEVLAVEADLGGTTLTIIHVYIPPAFSSPPELRPRL